MFILYHEIYPLKSRPRTAAALAISAVESSRKVFKGYVSYEAAHSAWDGFTTTGHLPSDVAMSLGTRSYPTPPIPSTPSRVSAPPSTPQRLIPMPLTPRSTYTPIKTVKPTVPRHCDTLSPSAPSASIQTRNTAALAIAREAAFQADQEDFWVVFTGTSPGVHQGR